MVIDFIAFVAAGSVLSHITALFQDTTANAIQGFITTVSIAGHSDTTVLRHIMSAGTTSATTFKIRFGPGTSGTGYMNSVSVARFDTVNTATFMITEYAS